MTTEKALSIIYERYSKVTGDNYKAKCAVSDFLFATISQLEDKGCNVTPEAIKEAIVMEADFCLGCDKASVA